MLDNQVVVVTGGAGVLGRAFCKAVSRHGGVAVVADVNHEGAEAVVQDIEADKGLAISLDLDICDGTAIDVLIDDLVQRFGRIDAVVNNAYPRNENYGRKLEEIEYNDFCDNINQHLGGYFLVSQRFARYFKKKRAGNIINMASVYGLLAPRFDVYEDTEMTTPLEYANIKAAVIQMTRYFAQYYKKAGIRCNSISPGGILDKQPTTFLKRYEDYCGTKGMLNTEDVEGCLIFLLSERSKFITGQNLIVDDGFSL